MTALMWIWDKCLGAHEIQKRYYTKGFIRIEIALFIPSLSFQMYWSEGQKENLCPLKIKNYRKRRSENGKMKLQKILQIRELWYHCRHIKSFVGLHLGLNVSDKTWFSSSIYVVRRVIFVSTEK